MSLWLWVLSGWFCVGSLFAYQFARGGYPGVGFLFVALLVTIVDGGFLGPLSIIPVILCLCFVM